jgi:acetolactate synthase small subunit
MRRTLIAHVENVPGLLARVDGLFRRHSIPVESLVFDAAATPARLTITARASAEAAALVVKQMRRFEDVRDVHETAFESAHETVAHLKAAR